MWWCRQTTRNKSQPPLSRVQWPWVGWGSTASSETVHLVTSVTKPQHTVSQLQQHDNHSHTACKHILIPLTMTQSPEMSQLRLPNYIVIATLNNTNGITFAAAHSAAVYLLKSSDLLIHITNLSSLCYFPLKQLSSKFSSRESGAVSKKTPFRTGTLADLPASPEEGISTFPLGRLDHGQTEKSAGWTQSKPCPAESSHLEWGKWKPPVTKAVLLSRGCHGKIIMHAAPKRQWRCPSCSHRTTVQTLCCW